MGQADWRDSDIKTKSIFYFFLPVSGAVVVMADVSEVGREQPFCLWARNTSKLLYCCLQRPQMWMSGLTSTTIECPDEREQESQITDPRFQQEVLKHTHESGSKGYPRVL